MAYRNHVFDIPYTSPLTQGVINVEYLSYQSS
jgi:hypothetical protein